MSCVRAGVCLCVVNVMSSVELYVFVACGCVVCAYVYVCGLCVLCALVCSWCTCVAGAVCLCDLCVVCVRDACVDLIIWRRVR